jgi:hypothetical protein
MDVAIDQLVYELYGLTEEEIGVVESSTDLKRIPMENSGHVSG